MGTALLCPYDQNVFDASENYYISLAMAVRTGFVKVEKPGNNCETGFLKASNFHKTAGDCYISQCALVKVIAGIFLCIERLQCNVSTKQTLSKSAN